MPKVGDIVLFKIAENEYRPLLIVKIRMVSSYPRTGKMKSEFLLTGRVFLDLWNDHGKVAGLGGEIINTGELYVVDVPEGDGIGQWKKK